MKLHKLTENQENSLPKDLQIIRQFYFKEVKE